MKVFYIICINVLLLSCNSGEEKFKLVREDADYIQKHLNSEDIINKFPKKYFPVQQTEQVLSHIRNNCNWSQRKGGFKDYIETYNSGKLTISVVYEYKTDCGGMEFIMIYLFQNDNPELHEVKINSI